MAEPPMMDEKIIMKVIMYNDSKIDIDIIYNSGFNKYPRWRVVFKRS